MGIKYSHCIDGNCIRDEQVINKPSIETEIILQSPKSILIEFEQQVESVVEIVKIPSEQLSNNSDSDSDQSVLSTISPTKPRRSSLDSISHNSIVDNLYMTTLYIEDEIVDEWIELRDILQHGSPDAFLDYCKANPIPINNIRFINKRYTPLHMAVYYSNFDMVKCLIQAGANINMKDEDGSTAVGLAYACVSTEILIFLLNIKAKEFLTEPNSPYAVSSIATSVRSQNQKYPTLRRNRSDSRDSFDNISILSEYELPIQYLYHANDIDYDKTIESRTRSKSLPANHLSNNIGNIEHYSPSREIFCLQSPVMTKVSSISNVINKDTEDSTNQIIENNNINNISQINAEEITNISSTDEIQISDKKKTKKTFKNNLRKVAGRIIDFPFRPSKIPTTQTNIVDQPSNNNKIPIHSNIKTKVSFFENINSSNKSNNSNKKLPMSNILEEESNEE